MIGQIRSPCCIFFTSITTRESLSICASRHPTNWLLQESEVERDHSCLTAGQRLSSPCDAKTASCCSLCCEFLLAKPETDFVKVNSTSWRNAVLKNFVLFVNSEEEHEGMGTLTAAVTSTSNRHHRPSRLQQAEEVGGCACDAELITPAVRSEAIRLDQSASNRSEQVIR